MFKDRISLFMTGIAMLSVAGTLAMTLVATGCGGDGGGAKTDKNADSSADKASDSGVGKQGDAGKLLIYSGRKKNFVEPIVAEFEKATGIEVDVKYGKTPQLALAIQQEGERSPADLFFAQDTASLGALSKAGVLIELPAKTFSKVRPAYVTPDKNWVGTSGRARVLAYAPSRVEKDELPTSIFALTDAKWKGRVGWAPSNGSFQAFVTAMRATAGEAKTKQWLSDMKGNEPVVFPKNTPIIQALADPKGPIDVGIPNHYYLLRFISEDADYPVKQQFFAEGDIGNLVFVAGVGVLKSSKNHESAKQFVAFLLNKQSQSYFTNDLHEYPVSSEVAPRSGLLQPDELGKAAPKVKLEVINDVAGTQKMLREVGLLE